MVPTNYIYFIYDWITEITRLSVLFCRVCCTVDAEASDDARSAADYKLVQTFLVYQPLKVLCNTFTLTQQFISRDLHARICSKLRCPLIFQCTALHICTRWTAIREQFVFQYLPLENTDLSPGDPGIEPPIYLLMDLPFSPGRPYSGWQLQKQERVSADNISACGL